jgi:hypothetical protein
MRIDLKQLNQDTEQMGRNIEILKDVTSVTGGDVGQDNQM